MEIFSSVMQYGGIKAEIRYKYMHKYKKNQGGKGVCSIRNLCRKELFIEPGESNPFHNNVKIWVLLAHYSGYVHCWYVMMFYL